MHGSSCPTPFADEVERAYKPTAEKIRHLHYQTDLLLAAQSKATNPL
jgi:hypothetical protein